VAVKEVRVSDLTGEQDDNMARLVVVSHPKFSGPITLDVREEEVRDLESLGDLVELEYTPPEGRTRKLIVSAEDFGRLGDNMDAILTEAVARSTSRRTVTQAAGKRRGGKAASRGKVDYATIEHAGEPHRGRITDAEKRIVQENFDEVNRRLSQKGMRMLDPADPKIRERYGLPVSR
jgi:hypothetical protein